MEYTKKYEEESSSFLNNIKDEFNLLMVTATKIEKETLHDYLRPIAGRKNLIRIPFGTQTYFLGIFGKYNVLHAPCDNMGAIGAQSSIMTTLNAINYCDPKVVLMVGIAFGISENQKIGDVLVSESLIPYENQKISKGEILQRGTPISASSTLVNRFRHVSDWDFTVAKKRRPSIIIGPVLSGEKLIDNKEFRDSLSKAYPLAKGGEMEGYGVFSACDGKQIHPILVKAICDFADGNKRQRKKHNQKVAAKAAIDLCNHVFNSQHSFTDLKLTPVGCEIEERKDDKKILPTSEDIESQIISEMTEIDTYLSVTVQEIVRSFLQMDDQTKISIAKKIGVFDDDLNQLFPHIRDKEIFTRIKQKNLLNELWSAIKSVTQHA